MPEKFGAVGDEAEVAEAFVSAEDTDAMKESIGDRVVSAPRVARRVVRSDRPPIVARA